MMEFFQGYFDRRYNTWFVFCKKPLVFEPSANYAPGAMRYVCAEHHPYERYKITAR